MEETDGSISQKSKKPNWFVCFFKITANGYLSGFIGKDLLTGEKYDNRFLIFIINVFVLITKSLPIALFVSYFLITLPAWLFALAIVMMACSLFSIVITTNQRYKGSPSSTLQEQLKEELENNKEQANNHAKFYAYNNKYYKNRPTTLIGDFFRYIGNIWFSSFAKKNFLLGEYINSETAKACLSWNIAKIIPDIPFLITVVLCFFVTIPTWLFVLAIVAAASKFISLFSASYITRQNLRKEVFFCKCQGGDTWHASLRQVSEKSRYNGVPKCEFIDENNFKSCSGLS